MTKEKDYRLEQIWDNEVEGLEWKMQETKSLIELIKKEAQREYIEKKIKFLKDLSKQLNIIKIVKTEELKMNDKYYIERSQKHVENINNELKLLRIERDELIAKINNLVSIRDLLKKGIKQEND